MGDIRYPSIYEIICIGGDFMAKYGEAKYGTFKYGVFKTFIANVSVSAIFNKYSTFLKMITCTISAGVSVQRIAAHLKQVVANIKVDSNITRLTNKICTSITYTTINLRKFISKKIQAAINIIAKAFRYWKVYPNLSHIDYEIELEVVGMSIAGSTITLTGKFPSRAGSLTQLESVTVKVYAPGRILIDTIPATEVSDGVYTANYTIPEDKFGQFDYEFSGVLGDKTIVGRSSFDSHWK